jgi:hypothetical protein
MFLLAGVLLTVFLLGGIARLVLSFKNSATLLNSQRPLTKRHLFIIGITNVACASLGLYCLFSKIVDPFTTTIVVLLVTSGVEIILRLASRFRGPEAG